MESATETKPEAINFPYKHIAQFPVEAALRTLNNTRMPGPTAYKVGKIAYELEKAVKKIRKEYSELCKTFDPSWEVGSGEPKLEGDKVKEFKAAEEKFFEDGMALLKRPKLDFGLIQAQLSPSELMALEPIFTNLPN